jgi:hypothetical protein
MSYKCAIFGHKYGDPEVEREREEDGNEVIITVRETETCRRCEKTRVVSENKEVTTLETAADIVADDLDEGDQSPTEPTPQPGTESGPESTPTNQGTTASATGDPTPNIPEAESSMPEDVDPEEDDAVILDDDSEDEDEDEEEDREPGEWPDESEDGEEHDEETNWPEQREESTDEPDWELPTDIDPHPETEGGVGGSVGDTLTVPEGEFYCAECGFTTEVESSSLRAGDFCPECHKGTLEHQRD